MKGFKKKFGMEVYEYLKFLRMEKVKELLLEGKSIATILPLVGYTSKEAIYLGFKAVYKKSLGSWREEAIRAKTQQLPRNNDYTKNVKVSKAAHQHDDSMAYYYAMRTP